MKNKTRIIAIIACALLFFDSFKIMRMQNEIDNLRSNLNNEINAISRETNSIYANVQDMLDKEASQLSSAEWEYGNIDELSKAMRYIYENHDKYDKKKLREECKNRFSKDTICKQIEEVYSKVQ